MADFYYHINRSTETPEGSITKFVKEFECIEDALNELYRQAKRHGYLVAVDNTPDGSWGFCLWQIHVQVGKWRYYVTVETDETLELMGF